MFTQLTKMAPARSAADHTLNICTKLCRIYRKGSNLEICGALQDAKDTDLNASSLFTEEDRKQLERYKQSLQSVEEVQKADEWESFRSRDFGAVLLWVRGYTGGQENEEDEDTRFSGRILWVTSLFDL